MPLELPGIRNDHDLDEEEALIAAQRRALGILTRRINMGDPPPNVTKAIDDVIAGKIPQW